jgi:hypothetical protein
VRALSLVVVIFLSLLRASDGRGETILPTGLNANNKPVRNLPAATEATNPARRDDVSPATAGYLKGPGSHGFPFTASATIPAADVTLTATQIGFGSGSNTVTSADALKFTGTTAPVVTIGNGSTSTNARVVFDTTGPLSSSVYWQTGGTSYMTLNGLRDGTASTGRVLGSIVITPVSGGAGNDRFTIGNNTSGSSTVVVYPGLGDVALGGLGADGGGELGNTATNGFVFLPRMNGAPTAVPERDAAIAGPRDRQAVVIDRASNRLYFYDTLEAAWHFTAFDDVASAVPATRTLTPSDGVLIDGGTIAVDMSANRTIGARIDNSTITFTAGAMQRAALAGGDVTAPAGSNVLTVVANAVSYAKMQDVTAASRIIGRGSAAGAGDPEEIIVGSGLAMTGTTLSATATGVTDGDKGDVTVSGSGATWTIDNDAVSDAKLRNSGALTLIGRSVNTSGDPADIAASAGSGCVYREGSSTIACGTIATAGYADDSVTDAKIREFAGLSVLGRGSNSTGNGADITAGADGDVLRRSGTTLGFGAVAQSSITNLVSDLAAKAPVGATYITQTADGTLTNERALGALATGALCNTTTTGTLLPCTISTGLTQTGTTLTANLSTGVNGGQTLVFGTGSGDNGTFSTTAHGTKGKFVFGSTTGMQFNEASNVFSIGIATPASGPSAHLKKTSGAAGNNIVYVQNSTATGYEGLRFGASDDASSGILGGFNLYNSSYATSGHYHAGLMELVVQGGSGNLRLGVLQNAGDIVFTTGTGETERMRVANNGNVSIANLASGVVWATSGTLSIASTAQVASQITWPGSNRVLYSPSTSTAPVASDEIKILGDELSIGEDSTQSWCNTGTTAVANYECVTAAWASDVYTITSVAGGTGTVRSMRINSGTAGLILASAALSGSVGSVNLDSNDSASSTLTGSGSNNFSIFDWNAVSIDGSASVHLGSPQAALDIDSATNAFDINSTPIVASNISAQLNAVRMTGGASISGTTQIDTPFAFASVSPLTYNTSGAGVTVTNPVGLYVSGAPTAGVNVSFTKAYGFWVDDGFSRFDGLVETSVGADIASANNMTLSQSGATGNIINITGNTEIRTLSYSVAAPKVGTTLTLVFASNPTVKHNTGTTIKFDLAGDVDYATTAGATLTVFYDGTFWKEIGRAAP